MTYTVDFLYPSPASPKGDLNLQRTLLENARSSHETPNGRKTRSTVHCLKVLNSLDSIVGGENIFVVDDNKAMTLSWGPAIVAEVVATMKGGGHNGGKRRCSNGETAAPR